MRALQLTSPGKLKLKENIAVPKINSSSILLKVEYCGICSSDIKFIDKSHRVKKYPITLGHEIAGTIVKIGKKVKKFKINDKIALGAEIGCGVCFYCKTNRIDFCNNQISVGTIIDGGFADYFVINSNFINNGPIIKLDKKSDMSLACLSESVACVINGIEIAKQNNFHSVVILGCGYMGLIFSYVLKKMYNTDTITIIDNNSKRLQIANQIGLKSTMCLNLKEKNISEKILKKNKMQKFDFVISANNNLSSHKLAIDLVSRGGCVNLFGGIPKSVNDVINISVNKIHYDQINLTGSFSSNKRQLKLAYNFIKKNKLFFYQIVSKPIDISQAIEYFNHVRFNKIFKGVVRINEL